MQVSVLVVFVLRSRNRESRRFYKEHKSERDIFKVVYQTEPHAHKTGLTIDLTSTKCLPQVKELVPFEEDLIKLARNLRF